MNIDQNFIYLIVGVVVISVIIKILSSGRKPPKNDFICARCKKKESYSTRTIEAWRQGLNKIYCQSCHQLWLKNNPHNLKPNKASGGGCFSVLIIVTIIPATIYGVVKYLFY